MWIIYKSIISSLKFCKQLFVYMQLDVLINSFVVILIKSVPNLSLKVK